MVGIVSDASLEALQNATKFAADMVNALTSITTLEKDVVSGIIPRDVPAVIYIYDGFSPIKQTNKFILSNVIRQRSEKFQLIETFGSPSLFFFGEKVKIYSIQGFVLDSGVDKDNNYDYEWAAELQYFYENYLSGSNLALAGTYAVLKANGLALTGYPIQLSFSKTADMENYQQFSMTWLIDSDVPEQLLVSGDPLNYGSAEYTQLAKEDIMEYMAALDIGDRSRLATFFNKLKRRS